jgi:hypothetical protein
VCFSEFADENRKQEDFTRGNTIQRNTRKAQSDIRQNKVAPLQNIDFQALNPPKTNANPKYKTNPKAKPKLKKTLKT